MAEYRTQLHWERKTPDFVYETYDRSHQITFGGGTTITASAAVEYLGKKELPNPEELLAASLSGCHMLTFLAIAAKYRFVVESYEDEATATLAKNGEGRMAVTQITLRPKVRFGGDKQPDAVKLRELHDKSGANCFIEASLRCKVVVEI